MSNNPFLNLKINSSKLIFNWIGDPEVSITNLNDYRNSGDGCTATDKATKIICRNLNESHLLLLNKIGYTDLKLDNIVDLSCLYRSLVKIALLEIQGVQLTKEYIAGTSCISDESLDQLALIQHKLDDESNMIFLYWLGGVLASHFFRAISTSRVDSSVNNNRSD